MLSLQLLGGVSVQNEAGPLSGPATQRRRLAFLVLLAAAPNGVISRDKLIGHLWGDEEREKARHFLADSLFSLRKSLGKDSILTVGDDLVLNREVVECDLWRFHGAIEQGEMERAVAAYRGPFLDGFFISDAPGFERWVEEERSRLARLYRETLEKRAVEAEREGDRGAASLWWRRVAENDPFSSRVALRLMQALSRAGDRAAALRHAQVHAALLREELGVSPDAEVEALAASLAAPRELAPALIPIPAPEAATPDPEPEPESHAPPSPAASPPASPPAATSRGHRLVLIPLIGIVLLGGMAAFWAQGRGREEGAAGETSPRTRAATHLAVMPFDYRGVPEYAYLGEGLVSLLSTSLNGAGDLRSVEPSALLSQAPGSNGSAPMSPERAGELASDLGAELFVLGSVVEAGGRLRITATLYRAGLEPVVVRNALVEGEDVFTLVDDLSRQFVAGELASPADRLSRLAVLTTSSLPALKAYLQGERLFRAAEYPRATAAFRVAVREDPSFALAYYRLSTAAEWSFRFTEAKAAARQAVRLSEGLSPRDRQLVTAWQRFVTGDAVEAERLYNAILAEHPTDVEAWSGLGEVRVHYNPTLGRPVREAIPAFQRVLRLAPSYGEARFHMLEFAAADGDVAGFDSLLARVDPMSPQMHAWQAARALAWGTPARRERVVGPLEDAEEVVVGIAAARAAAHFRDLDAAETLAGLLAHPERPEAWRAAGRILTAQLQLARGEWEAASVQLEAAQGIEPGWALEVAALATLLPFAPNRPQRLREIRGELELYDPSRLDPELVFFLATHADVHAQLRHYLLALLSVRLGDAEAADRHLNDLRGSGGTLEGREFVETLLVSVEAHRAAWRGDPAAALRMLQAEQFAAPLERVALSPFFARSPDRYLRAEALLALGRREEALRWYASLTDGPDILYWAAAHQRQGELLRDLGRLEEADRHLERSRSLRSTPPERAG